MKLKKKSESCNHPPARLYSWFADEFGKKILCVGCCKCGKVLEGGVE